MGSQGMPTGVVALDKVRSWEKEVWRGRSVLSTGHGSSREVRLQQVFCHNDSNELSHWI